MAGFYQTLTAVRATEPDLWSLFTQLRALDPSVGIQHSTGSTAYTLKKGTAWTGPQVTAAQNVLETAPASTPQLTAQANILRWPIEMQALVLSLVDTINDLQSQINAARALLPNPPAARGAITPAQALNAVSTKAATL